MKYRIDYQQFAPFGGFDLVATDNGKHFRMFNRIDDTLRIGPTHPIHGDIPTMQNPILEPLIPLAPFFPFHHHKWTPHVQWVNLARIVRNPNSVFNRCRQVRDCEKTGPGGSLHGCILGAYSHYLAHVTFTVDGGRTRYPLVTGWTAKMLQYPGSYTRLGRIRYRTFHLPAGRKIFLPVEFELKGVAKNVPGPISGPFRGSVVVSHISIDKPIPPGKFTINYKLAHFIIEVTGHGKSRKFHYITVHPATRPHHFRRNQCYAPVQTGGGSMASAGRGPQSFRAVPDCRLMARTLMS